MQLFLNRNFSSVAYSLFTQTFASRLHRTIFFGRTFSVKITVYVKPKKTVLDPQGTAVGHAMKSLGFDAVSEVRIGKTIEFESDGADTPEFRKELDRVCGELLSNPVIEDFSYQIEG